MIAERSALGDGRRRRRVPADGRQSRHDPLVVRGIGSYLPAKVLTNDDLAAMVDTSDEWIVQRTGIRERHIAADGEMTSDLGDRGCPRALANAGLRRVRHRPHRARPPPRPDNTFPATAVTVQDNLGIRARRRLRPAGGLLRLRLCPVHGRRAAAGRAGQARAGHRRGDLLAHPRLERPHHLRALRRRRRRGRAGSWQKARERSPIAACSPRICAPTASTAEALRRWRPVLDRHGRASPHGGQEVFKHAVGMITDVIEAAFAATGTGPDDIDWFVPHQANQRIIDASAPQARHRRAPRSCPPSRVTATPPPPPFRCRSTRPSRDGRMKRGDLVMLEAMGGGFTWGSALVRW